MQSKQIFRHLAKIIIVPSMLVGNVAFTTLAIAHNNNQKLQEVVLDRDSENRARDKYRNPVATLSFFHVEPGMKVAEALPGGGWYSNILANYLGKDGALYGINYNDDIWAKFGFFTEERIKEMVATTAKFPNMIEGFTDNGIASSGFTFATVPDDMNGTLDRVLFIRALHNLSRFEATDKTLTQALEVAFDLLKDEGLVGVVQHRAPQSAEDVWADGSRGYLKQSALIEAFKQAGFELVGTSEVNANSKDEPSSEDIVWRLPPTYNGVGDNAEKRAAMQAIGESDRMTLLFKKQGMDFSH